MGSGCLGRLWRNRVAPPWRRRAGASDVEAVFGERYSVCWAVGAEWSCLDAEKDWSRPAGARIPFMLEAERQVENAGYVNLLKTARLEVTVHTSGWRPCWAWRWGSGAGLAGGCGKLLLHSESGTVLINDKDQG